MDDPTRDLIQAAKYQRRLELRARLVALCREPEPATAEGFADWCQRVEVVQNELKILEGQRPSLP